MSTNSRVLSDSPKVKILLCRKGESTLPWILTMRIHCIVGWACIGVGGVSHRGRGQWNPWWETCWRPRFTVDHPLSVSLPRATSHVQTHTLPIWLLTNPIMIHVAHAQWTCMTPDVCHHQKTPLKLECAWALHYSAVGNIRPGCPLAWGSLTVGPQSPLHPPQQTLAFRARPRWGFWAWITSLSECHQQWE